MIVFTFVYITQWMSGFYQVIAEDEAQARSLLSINYGETVSKHAKIESEYSLYSYFYPDQKPEIKIAHEV